MSSRRAWLRYSGLLRRLLLSPGALGVRLRPPAPEQPSAGGAGSAAALHGSQALFDLEATNTELKADLRDLYITSAKEVDVPSSQRKAIIVHVRRGALPRAGAAARRRA